MNALIDIDKLIAPFIFWGGIVLVLLCVLSILRVIAPRIARFRRIETASRVLDSATVVRGPLGVATLARGVLDGAPVVITGKGIELDGQPRILLVADLKAALAGGRDALRARLIEAIATHRGTPLVRGSFSGTTCPYCKDVVATREAEGTIRCPSCESIHHTPCWQEHGGCSVHGCARVPSADAPSRDRHRAR